VEERKVNVRSENCFGLFFVHSLKVDRLEFAHHTHKRLTRNTVMRQ
jgi:hypothetical protein